jgi:diguanylate cyclase (GGDEF)-like protein/PAS domain S-box-containing protein
MENLAEKTVYLDGILRSAIDMGIVATDRHFRILYVNPAAARLMNLSVEEMSGRDAREFHVAHSIDSTRFYAALDEIQRHGSHSMRFTRETSDGERHVDARISGIWNHAEELVGYVLMLRDVTEQLRTQKIIRHMAFHDPLTDLPNRSLFNERLGHELRHAKRDNTHLGLLLVDLNHFKQVNDTLGHAAGDEVLVVVAERLQGLVRQSDTVARMGGDEFMVVLPRLEGTRNAMTVAEKLMSRLEEPIDVNGNEVRVGASVGVAVYPDHGEDFETLLRVVDDAMYEAKDASRDPDSPSRAIMAGSGQAN